MKITDRNYINILGFMRTQLNLKGNELLVYAIIYGFSQDGKNRFTGSAEYLVEMVGASRKTIMNTLQNLCNKNLIKKKKVGNYCSYYADLDCVKITHLEEDNECVKTTQQVCKNYTEVCKNYTDECVEITHNNKYNTKDNKNNKESLGTPAVMPAKKTRKTKKEKALDKVIGKLQEYDFSEKVETKIIEFYEDRIEKKDYPAENQLTMTFNNLAAVSERKQLAALKKSISNGYKGIFIDNKNGKYDGIHIQDKTYAQKEKEKQDWDAEVKKGKVYTY